MTTKLRYGLIGAGARGRGHIQTVSALPASQEAQVKAEIVALFDPHRPSIELALQACPDPGAVRVHDDIEELLRDPEIDIIIIASPNHTHAAMVERAVRYDKHIFVEKPLAHTAEDAFRIVKLAEEFQRRSGKTFWVGMQLRFGPAISYLRRQVEEGVCGSVKMLAIREHREPFGVKVDDWIRFNDRSGGTLNEKSCHHFDLFNMLAKSKPVRVYASGAGDVLYKDEAGNGRRPDILDNAFVVVDYEDGKRAMLELCMFHPRAETHPLKLLSVTGDRGYVQMELPRNEVVVERFEPRAGGMQQCERVRMEDVWADIGEHKSGHFAADPRAHQAFLDCVLNGGRPETDARAGALAVYVALAGERSAREGRPVSIAEIEPTD